MQTIRVKGRICAKDMRLNQIPYKENMQICFQIACFHTSYPKYSSINYFLNGTLSTMRLFHNFIYMSHIMQLIIQIFILISSISK